MFWAHGELIHRILSLQMKISVKLILLKAVVLIAVGPWISADQSNVPQPEAWT